MRREAPGERREAKTGVAAGYRVLPALALTCSIVLQAMAADLADTVLVNGKIVTVDERFTIAQAIAVKGERVVYAYGDDQKKASEVRLKDVNAKGALAVKKK